MKFYQFAIAQLFVILSVLFYTGCSETECCTVDELVEHYTLEELEELYSILLDSSMSKDDKGSQELMEVSQFIKIDSVQLAIKVIYGPDDRVDVYQEEDEAKLGNARGVLALVKKNKLVKMVNGTYDLRGNTFGKDKNLCNDAGEAFYNQPISAFCTAFAVGPNTIVTAGHCIKSLSDLSGIRFVFDFKANGKDDFKTNFNANHVFTAKRIIARQHNPGRSTDYAIIETNETIPADRILSLNTSTNISNDQGLYVIGHPVGLPMKIAGGAEVRENENPLYFVANLDTYGGNSGSPVFNSETHQVEGILVRGETDFIKIGNCKVSNACPTSGCRGEDVSRNSQFMAHLGLNI